jgi:hypothetical protein
MVKLRRLLPLNRLECCKNQENCKRKRLNEEDLRFSKEMFKGYAGSYATSQLPTNNRKVAGLVTNRVTPERINMQRGDSLKTASLSHPKLIL